MVIAVYTGSLDHRMMSNPISMTFLGGNLSQEQPLADLVRARLSPPTLNMRVGDTIPLSQIRVIGEYSDGSQRDIRSYSVYVEKKDVLLVLPSNRVDLDDQGAPPSVLYAEKPGTTQVIFTDLASSDFAGYGVWLSVSVTPLPTPSSSLPQPQSWGLSASADDGQITLTWQAQQPPAGKTLRGYYIYRSTMPGQAVMADRVNDFPSLQTT